MTLQIKKSDNHRVFKTSDLEDKELLTTICYCIYYFRAASWNDNVALFFHPPLWSTLKYHNEFHWFHIKFGKVSMGTG